MTQSEHNTTSEATKCHQFRTGYNAHISIAACWCQLKCRRLIQVSAAILIAAALIWAIAPPSHASQRQRVMPGVLALLLDGQESRDIRLQNTRPADVYLFYLDDLGIDETAVVAKTSGCLIDALVKDGSLRIATDENAGKDQEGTVTLTVGASSIVLTTTVQAALPTDVRVHQDADEDGSPSSITFPKLKITGLGPNNELLGNALKFHIPGAPLLDTELSKGFMVDGNDNDVGMKSLWSYNPADSSFTISEDGMVQLMQGLQGGVVKVDLYFVSYDREFAVEYRFLAIRPSANIRGRVLYPDGGPVTGLSGRKVLVRGADTDLRRVVTVDAEGTFLVPDVIPDVYHLSLLELKKPDWVSSIATVSNDSTTVEVTLEYHDLPDEESSERYFDTPNPPNQRVSQFPEPCPPPDGSHCYSSKVHASSDCQMCGGLFNAGDRVSSLKNNPDNANGITVNHHGTVICIPDLFSGWILISWDNWQSGHQGNGYCTCPVQGSPLTDYSGWYVLCDDISKSDIIITDASISSLPGQDNIIAPVKTQNNLTGHYISISTSNNITKIIGELKKTFVPLTIKLSGNADKAEITEVNVGFRHKGSTGEIAFAAANLLASNPPPVISKGRISFPGIVMPPMPDLKMDGRPLEFFVRVSGKIGQVEFRTNPNDGGRVSFQGKTDFIPLYLAGEENDLRIRRYGRRDPGGDSWATYKSIEWLRRDAHKNFRFDDISAVHVAQTADGRSILNHSGHSDGQQIDLRYDNGDGTYGDNLGGFDNGTHIKKLLDDASKGVNLDAAKKWITANRNLIESQANAVGTRVVYFGDGWMMKALVDGKFPNDVDIPGMGKWTPPGKAKGIPGHLHHWHISIK